jgi:hypothetical protein
MILTRDPSPNSTSIVPVSLARMDADLPRNRRDAAPGLKRRYEYGWPEFLQLRQTAMPPVCAHSRGTGRSVSLSGTVHR